MYTVEYYEYDWQQNQISSGLFNTEMKRDAWDEFELSIAEHYHGKDFWRDFNWNDNLVESVHDAEDGYNICVLRKWDGFDDDVRLGWSVDGETYNSLEQLWKERPDFDGCSKETDVPYILNKDSTAKARLVIKENWEKE